MDNFQFERLVAETKKLEAEIKILKRPFYKKAQWLGGLLPLLLPLFSIFFYFVSEIGVFRGKELAHQKELLKQQTDRLRKDSLEFEKKREDLDFSISKVELDISKAEIDKTKIMQINDRQIKLMEEEKERLASLDQKVLNVIVDLQKVNKEIYNINDSSRLLGDKLSQMHHWLHTEEYANRLKRQKLQSLNLLNQ